KKALRPLQDGEGELVQVVKSAQEADWVVRLTGAVPELVEGVGARPPHRLPALSSPDFAQKLRDKLRAVYRARNLLAVSERLEQESTSGAAEIALTVEALCRRGKNGRTEVLKRPSVGWVFRPGDRVSFRVENQSKSARVDVHLLLVRSDLK